MSQQSSKDSSLFTDDYSRALRAIGSALEALEVEAFELTCDAANYIVRVNSPPRKKPPAAGVVTLLQRLLPKHHEPAPPVDYREIIYTPEKIKELDQDGQLRREESGKPDPHSLPQSLRAIGAYLYLKNARLIRIAKHGPFFTIEYETALDGCSTEEFTPSALYDVFVRLYLKRSNRLKTAVANGTRFFRTWTRGLNIQ
jgi:hypothetical protein